MPVKVWLLCCPVVHGKRFFTTRCNICSSHNVSTSCTVRWKITQRYITILNNFTWLQGNSRSCEGLHCVRRSASTSLCIVRNCTADTPITSSSLFARKERNAQRGYGNKGVTSRNTLRNSFPIPTMLYNKYSALMPTIPPTCHNYVTMVHGDDAITV